MFAVHLDCDGSGWGDSLTSFSIETNAIAEADELQSRYPDCCFAVLADGEPVYKSWEE